MKHCGERHRADTAQRVPFPPEVEDEEEEGSGYKSRVRGPSSPAVCAARYRLKSIVEGMGERELREFCLNALQTMGLIVTTRAASRDKRNAKCRERYQTDPEFRAKRLADCRKRDRTAETARRSAKRAAIRAEKEAAKLKASVTPSVTPTLSGSA